MHTLQPDVQDASQVETQRRGRFVPGQSGNPSGLTRTQRRRAEFCAEFKIVHGREPSAIEAVTLQNAAALAARIEGNRLRHDDVVRGVNALQRLLQRLGIALQGDKRTSTPSAPAASLHEYMAARRAELDREGSGDA